MKTLKKERIKLVIMLSFIAVAFLIFPYFWRKDEDRDIKANSKFAISKIVRLSSTLKSGNYWHYEFKYNNTIYENSRSTHVDYDVHLGDFF